MVVWAGGPDLGLGEALVEHANGHHGNRADRLETYTELSLKEHVPGRTAAQLIEAAFLLGVETGRRPVRSVGARWLTGQRVDQAA